MTSLHIQFKRGRRPTRLEGFAGAQDAPGRAACRCDRPRPLAREVRDQEWGVNCQSSSNCNMSLGCRSFNTREYELDRSRSYACAIERLPYRVRSGPIPFAPDPDHGNTGGGRQISRDLPVAHREAQPPPLARDDDGGGQEGGLRHLIRLADNLFINPVVGGGGKCLTNADNDPADQPRCAAQNDTDC